ncbi:MAG: DsrE family protein [Anaerolineaceae bacterium]|nr:DsrE family protein [Anaerolineaceae bacterium]MDD4043519.1 DsrE family protein [Anaerolineaceae bacterium]MDD4577321.1 DsrE family protein [Anaerolineaceae bacterium]
MLFTRNGLGDAPGGLQQALVVKYLSLLAQEEEKPSQILFYTEGVRLVCEGSLVLGWLRNLEEAGVELIVCSTCLEYFGLMDQVRVGKIGGMPGIVAAMQQADKVISL